MEIDIDLTGIENATYLMNIYPERVKKASYRALNRAIQAVETHIAGNIIKEYTIKKRDVRKSLKEYKATKTRLQAKLMLYGASLPIDSLRHRQNKQGVRVTIKKGESKLIKHAFIMYGKYDTPEPVVQRVGKTKLHVKRLHTLSVPQMVQEEDVSGIEDVMQGSFAKEFVHQLEQGAIY